jgi:nucleotide-binding universal stress UspA family protein
MLKLKTILVPVDFSPRSAPIAEHAVHMAERFGSALILAHVKEPTAYRYATYGLPGDTGAIDASLDRDSREQLAALVRQVSLGKPIETVDVSGDPAQQIKELIEQRHADLVMMATHGYGTFRRFILGSVTAKVLHDTGCAVFTGTHVPEVAKLRGPDRNNPH